MLGADGYALHAVVFGRSLFESWPLPRRIGVREQKRGKQLKLILDLVKP
jgi:hypothetical protein